MLAEKDETIERAVSGVWQLTEEEMIRERCRAREEWILNYNYEKKKAQDTIEHQKAEIEEREAQIEHQKAAIEQKDAELEQKDAEIEKMKAEIKRLKAQIKD